MGDRALRKSDLVKNWMLGYSSETCYNYERLQALGNANAFIPIIRRLYEPEQYAEEISKYFNFFNTEPSYMGTVIHGITAAMEEKRALDGDITADEIVSVRSALMGPLAGIGDTVWAGLMKPIFLSITLAWAMQGMIAGAWAYWLLAFGFDFGITYYMFMRGYKLGADSVDRFLEGGFVKTVTTAIGIVGMFCLGAMIVKYVGISAVLKIEMTTTTLDFGAILNKIVPSFVPLMMTLLSYWMQVKGKKVTTVLLVLFLIGFIGGAIGFLG